MPCFHRLTAYRLVTQRTERGKSVIVFNRKELGNRAWEPVKVACGQCIGCRVQKSRDWALRCVHEASLYSRNCFVTLTYDDDHLPEGGSLVKKDFQLFMKRLRKRFEGHDMVTLDSQEAAGGTKRTGRPIRFFHCGEYGEALKRPHHHACLFNFDFDDKVLWTVRRGKAEPEGVRLYRSAELEKLWPYGYSTVGDVTFKSAAYVARYVLKKMNGERKEAHYRVVDKSTGEVTQLEPEYITMSRRPGIARRWFEQYAGDVFPKDFVTLNGKEFLSPRYYDELYDLIEPEKYKKVRAERKRRAELCPGHVTPERLRVREKIQKLRIKKLKRSIEL